MCLYSSWTRGLTLDRFWFKRKSNIENMSQWELIRMTKFLGMEAVLSRDRIDPVGRLRINPEQRRRVHLLLVPDPART